MLGLSVVICAYSGQRWDALKAAVESIERQTHPPMDTIVVVDHNAELLERVGSEMPSVSAVGNKGTRGAGAARNTGVRQARGDVVAFLDDDAEPADTWLEEIARAHADRAILGIGGRIDPLWEPGRPRWFPDEFLWVVGCDYVGLPNGVAPIRNAIAANMSVEREIFLEAGGFLEGFGKVGTTSGADETELCIRLSRAHPSRPWLYWPAAKVFHRVPPTRATLGYFLARCYQEGAVKAALTSIAGGKASLSSERAYVLRVLPRGFLDEAWHGVSRIDGASLARAGVLLLGLLATTAGFVTVAVRSRVPRKPIE